MAISKIDLETSKVKVMSEVKGQGHILYHVSNRRTSFSFHINQTNHSWDMAKIVFDLEKTHPKFLNKICQNNSFQQNCSKIWSGNNHAYGNIAAMFCCDPMSGSHFILQTSKFVLIDATAVTLGQGHGKVIQYISPDPYILFAKYLRFLAQTVLMWEAKIVAAADAADRRKRTENIKSPKTRVTW